jgi:hypothetical protein
MSDNSKVIDQIAKCDDPDKLRIWIQNAKKQDADDVADAAFRKLVSIVPSEKPGTVEFDFWQMVNALEQTLTEERGKTTRLARTRQKVERVGERQVLTDWAFGKSETKGFGMLLERGMPEFTGEAIVLKHSGEFEADVVAAARKRLEDSGVDTESL